LKDLTEQRMAESMNGRSVHAAESMAEGEHRASP
jgi:hypothetical protein